MASHNELLDRLPAPAVLVADLAAKGVKITVGAVAMWRQRDDIPAHYWPTLVEIAHERSLPVTLEALARSQRRVRDRIKASI